LVWFECWAAWCMVGSRQGQWWRHRRTKRQTSPCRWPPRSSASHTRPGASPGCATGCLSGPRPGQCIAGSSCSPRRPTHSAPALAPRRCTAWASAGTWAPSSCTPLLPLLVPPFSGFTAFLQKSVSR
jgi:hypothetical protein